MTLLNRTISLNAIGSFLFTISINSFNVLLVFHKFRITP